MKRDILNADGTENEATGMSNPTVVQDNVGLPTSPTAKPTVLKEGENFIVKTTDKVGITTAGRLTRTFFWGLVIGAGAIMALGMWKDKISISYTK